MNKIFCAFLMIICMLLVGCGENAAQKDKNNSDKPGTVMKISSLAFEEGKDIPVQYTCKGEDISPALMISNVPEKAKSLALICDDPDAPRGIWVHWVIYNISPGIALIPEKISDGLNPILSRDSSLSAVHGINDFGKLGYGGPCPPPGSSHRYFFKLYALDTKLETEPKETEKSLSANILQQKMAGHILAETSTMGKFKR
jgi:Raf kinase inhibitor-like YbhB/YbcL family protein